MIQKGKNRQTMINKTLQRNPKMDPHKITRVPREGMNSLKIPKG